MAPLLALRASGSAAAKVVQEYIFSSICLGLLKEKTKACCTRRPAIKTLELVGVSDGEFHLSL